MIRFNKFNKQCLTYAQMNMIFNARIFWRRFTTWNRVYIISRYVGIGTAEEAFSHLYLETSGFGDMLQIVYERESSYRLSRLVNLFTFIFRDLVSSHIQGNLEAVRQNVDRLYKNADDMAAFLASINPFLDEAEWKSMLHAYAKATIEEANSFITGNYSKDLELFQQLTEISNQMGDSLAEGLYDYITADSMNHNNLTPTPQNHNRCITYDQMNQIFSIRMFWFELATWTRAYMLSRYRGVGNTTEVKERLKQAPALYIEMMKQFFGEKIEPNLQELNRYVDLLEHLITAQIDGNADEINRTTQLLYQISDQRAAFLSSINPFWNENEWRTRLSNHLRSTIDESTTLLTGDYTRNIDIFSGLLEQAESISGYVARGLYQFIENQSETEQKE